MKWMLFVFAFVFPFCMQAQIVDSTKTQPTTDSSLMQTAITEDTVLRIVNLDPYITLHVDSVFTYDLELNRDSVRYFWFLRNGPVGLRVNRDNGQLYMNAEKPLFRSGRLKYDTDYKVQLGVQNPRNPVERVDTSFVIRFYNTEINLSKVKPTVSSTLYVEEGDSIAFKVLCETGTFPIESISIATNLPITYNASPTHCGDNFAWLVPFDFIREGDTAKQRSVTVQFIGADKFYNKDTASVRIFVREGINYPLRYQEYNQLLRDLNRYISQLKYTFKQMDKQIKTTKTTRTTFDLTAASTALGGTIISSTNNSNSFGKVLPGVGVALVPVKEAVAPPKNQEQNTTTQIRAVIKRLEYLKVDNSLIGNRDPDVSGKIRRMKDELKQAQLQLIDTPIMENDQDESEHSVNDYFNDPKVNRKYKTKKK
jgi:hypothetical protein